MPLTMENLAKLAGTSRATVSDVLRDRWREKGISQQTYQRIMEVVSKTNYRPNQIARSLVRNRTQVIGVLVASFLYDYFTSIIKHLDATAREFGYHILLAAPAAWQDEAEELGRLYEHKVDGLILTPQRPERMKSILDSLRSEKVPMVFLENAPLETDFQVTDDNFNQARMAVEHLIGLGHKKIGHTSGPIGYSTSENRKLGYVQTLQAHGLPCPAEYSVVGNFEYDRAYQETKKMLTLDDPPTAIYCANDIMALATIKAVEEAGLKTPDDISIVGHGNDIPFFSYHRIPLTTIRQPAEATAKLAMKTLIDLVEGRGPERTRVTLPGELIVRASTGPVRN